MIYYGLFYLYNTIIHILGIAFLHISKNKIYENFYMKSKY